ncbi:MAG: phosphonate C-P lyase system protein PhnH [Anaerolineae bacterium]|nr:phosphonate C-P lyase system protein PhnH [Anaerolineae bacterium]
MTIPPYTASEAQSRETFLALMWSLSYPGRLYQLPALDTAFNLIAGALLDLETSYYTPEDSLKPLLAQTGAQALAVEQAAYHFYPAVGEEELTAIQQASVGTMLYPDEAATLIIRCTLGSGTSLTLRGPGIHNSQILLVSDLPETFWQLRQTACRFPLGWDVYFVDGQQLVGLPRSVQVELL